MILTLVSLLLFNALVIEGHEVHDLKGNWDYNNQLNWKDSYPFCAGKRQSPIDFEDACFSGSVTHVNNSLRLKLMKYNLPLPIVPRDSIEGKKLTFKNNGHTAKLFLEGTNEANDWSPKISGIALNHDVYQFNELHFHWDENDTRGSEHSIHGSRHALEMHMVHWNVKYNTMKEAADREDGLVVISILFTPSIKENRIMSPIVDYLDDIVPFGSEVLIHEYFTLRSLLPLTFQTFYKYQGSLTTPPCSESVTWIVLTQVQKIGYSQLNEFTRLDNRENTFGDTNRKLQNLNDRLVEVSSDDHCFRPNKKRRPKGEKKKKDRKRDDFQNIATPLPVPENQVQSPVHLRDQKDEEPFNFWQLLSALLTYSWLPLPTEESIMKWKDSFSLQLFNTSL